MHVHHPLSRHPLVMAGLAALAVACGGVKPPVSSPEQATAEGPTPPAPPPAPRPTTSANVSISDEIRAKCGIPDADAYFTFDSSHLTSHDRAPLDLVVKCFRTGPLAGRAVKLVGHADPRGAGDYNMALGESRADAVASYLGSHGLTKEKTQPSSRGAMDADGTDENGWSRDRRVDVLLGD